ncbi:MAG: hypothetical protein RLZZ165_1559, partial [Bacteroidota bacterium]
DYWKPGKIPDAVVSVCLRFLPPERRSVLAVKLMDLDYWKPGKIPEQVVSVCLPCFPPERQGVLAVELMDFEYWKPGKIPQEVVSVCLPCFPPERQGVLAGKLMDFEYWKPGKIPQEVVSACLPFLPPERQGVLAGKLMDLDFWKPGKIPHPIVLVCLPFLPPEKRRMVAVEALVPDFSKHFPVDPALVAVVCRIMGDEVSEEAKVLQDWSGKWRIQQRLALAHSVGNNQATVRALNAAVRDSGWLGYRQGLCFPYYEPWVEVHRAALRDWRQDRNLCFNALKHKGIFPGEVRRVCGEILAGWREELELLSTDPSMHYNYFLCAMGHPHLRPESQEVAERMGAWLHGRNLQDTDRFYALAAVCRRIVEAGEFPWLVDPYCICEKRRAEMEGLGNGNPG